MVLKFVVAVCILGIVGLAMLPMVESVLSCKCKITGCTSGDPCDETHVVPETWACWNKKRCTNGGNRMYMFMYIYCASGYQPDEQPSMNK